MAESNDSVKTIPVYVAGAFKHKQKIVSVMKDLEKNGFHITHKWTEVEVSHDSVHEDFGRWAEQDENGVRNAEVVLIYITDPNHTYRGTSTELGIAIALRKFIVVVDPDYRPMMGFHENVFAAHPLVHHVNSMDGFYHLYVETHPNRLVV